LEQTGETLRQKGGKYAADRVFGGYVFVKGWNEEEIGKSVRES
jgi:hypothetical protein